MGSQPFRRRRPPPPRAAGRLHGLGVVAVPVVLVASWIGTWRFGADPIAARHALGGSHTAQAWAVGPGLVHLETRYGGSVTGRHWMLWLPGREWTLHSTDVRHVYICF